MATWWTASTRRRSPTEDDGPEDALVTLYEESWFTFRFGDDRVIPRFHLGGVLRGRRIAVHRADPVTGERLGLLARAVAGEGGWVDLPEPLFVRAGDCFVAVPEPELTG
jgi:hypothetical protein